MAKAKVLVTGTDGAILDCELASSLEESLTNIYHWIEQQRIEQQLRSTSHPKTSLATAGAAS